MDWLGFFSNLVARVPVERILLPPRDNTGELEKFYQSLTSAQTEKEAAPPVKTTVTTQEPAKSPDYAPAKPTGQIKITSKAGTGCRPCTSDHLATCAGALGEALRFARTDGVNSDDIQQRIALCAEELNIWERWDAAPKSFTDLSDQDKDFLRRWLPRGRGLRHQVNQIETLGDLEKAAAHAQRLHLEARKELKERGNPFLEEVERQAERVKAGEITREQAIKELEKGGWSDGANQVNREGAG